MKRLVTALLSAVALVLTSAAPALAGSPGSWPQQGGDAAHTSRVRSPGNLRPATVRSLRLQRSTPTTALPGFAVAGSVAYGTTPQGRLVAWSTSTGARLWSTPTCDGRPQGQQLWADTAPAVQSGRAWVNSGHQLTGVSLRTHRVIACVPVGTPGELGAGSPTVQRGTVYVANGTRVYAVAAATGAPRWTRRLPSAGVSVGTVAVDAGLVLVPASSPSYDVGRVYALRTRNGSTAWSHRSPGVTSVTASGGRVLLDDPLTALDESTGRVLWSNPAYLPGAGLSVDRRSVYVYCGEASVAPNGGTCDGDVLALDAATGRVLWRTSIASEGAGVVSTGRGVVYVTDVIDSGRLFLLDAATGAVLARRGHAGGFYTSQPVVVAGHVYLLGSLLDGSAGFVDRLGLRTGRR